MDTLKTYGIGEVASIFSLSDATLRKYEKDYDIKIPRDELGHRYYTDKEIDVFKQIISLKEQGANIHVIRKMLERSVDFKEQQEQSLELITIDKLTGQEFKDMIMSQLSDAIIEREKELSRQYEEKLEKVKEGLKEEIREEFKKQQEQMESNNMKLVDYIDKHREDMNKKKSIWDFFRRG